MKQRLAPCNGTTFTPPKLAATFLPPTIAHYNGTLQWHPAVAPTNGTTSTPPKLVANLLEVRTPIAIAILGEIIIINCGDCTPRCRFLSYLITICVALILVETALQALIWQDAAKVSAFAWHTFRQDWHHHPVWLWWAYRSWRCGWEARLALSQPHPTSQWWYWMQDCLTLESPLIHSGCQVGELSCLSQTYTWRNNMPTFPME